MYKKFKSIIFEEAFYFAFLLVLVAVLSFGLGRISVLGIENTGSVSTGIVFIDPDITQPIVDVESGISVVASKSGSKYYLLNCSGSIRIKDENKIYFNSYKTAEAAGYSQAANCDGF